MSSPTFSIFIPLNYEDNKYSSKLDWSEKNEYNKRFKQILETSSLYAMTFTEVNDIDEGRYNMQYGIPKKCNEHNDIVSIILGEANSVQGKKAMRICCFSLEDKQNGSKEFKEDLMWAYYANGKDRAGVRINFNIDEQYFEKYVHEIVYSNNYKQVKYKNKTLEMDKQKVRFENNGTNLVIKEEDKKELDKIITTFMTRKKTCWIHEQEHRAIFNIYENDIYGNPDFHYPQYKKENEKEHYRFPITIKEIILSRRFCKINKQFEENKEHIQCITEQIKNILIKSGKYKENNLSDKKDNLLKIKAYRERYADKPLWELFKLKIN